MPIALAQIRREIAEAEPERNPHKIRLPITVKVRFIKINKTTVG